MQKDAVYLGFEQLLFVYAFDYVYISGCFGRSAFSLFIFFLNQERRLFLFIFEISSGAIDVAQDNLEDLIRQCSIKLNPPLNLSSLSTEQNENFNQLVETQEKSLSDVIKELIRQVIVSTFKNFKNYF